MRRYWVLMSLLLILALPSFAQEETTHVVQSGETLYRISLRYGVSMADIARANSIANYSNIYVGESLIIPGLGSPTASADVDNPLVATAPIVHTVRRGDTMYQIAQLYHVTIDEILQANNLASANHISPGQELQIWNSDLSVPLTEPTPQETAPVVEPVTVEEPVVAVEAPVAANTVTATHIVQWGEHLSTIAQRYGVPWTSIAEANGITNPNTIYAGMTLLIPNASTSVVATVTDSSVMTELHGMTVDSSAPGAHWGAGRELVVDLSTQMAYAYEDGTLQYSALVSTGLPATPTVQGEYAIYHKLASQTMSGPGYYLPGVQWVMYFYSGYGFHGTYWHNNFGNPMSHGCVNMTNNDALWFYNFASIGTPVYVQW